MGPGLERRQAQAGEFIGDQEGPGGIHRGVADVDHDDVADLVPGQEVAATQPAKGDGHGGGGDGGVRGAGGEVEPGGAVHRQHRDLEVGDPVYQRLDRRPRSTLGPGAQQRINDQSDVGPRSIARHLAHPFLPRPLGHLPAERRLVTGRPGHPDRNAMAMEHPGRHPAVTAVVPGTRRDQHSRAEAEGEPLGQHPGCCPACRLHEQRQGDSLRLGAAIPCGGLFGGEDGDGH